MRALPSRAARASAFAATDDERDARVLVFGHGWSRMVADGFPFLIRVICEICDFPFLHRVIRGWQRQAR